MTIYTIPDGSRKVEPNLEGPSQISEGEELFKRFMETEGGSFSSEEAPILEEYIVKEGKKYVKSKGEDGSEFDALDWESTIHFLVGGGVYNKLKTYCKALLLMKELKKAYPVYISKKLSSRVVSNLSLTSSDNEDPELKIFTKIKDEFISKYKVEVSEDVIDVVLLCYKHNDMATAFQNAVKLSNYKPLFNSLLEGNGETLSDDELIKLGEYLFIRGKCCVGNVGYDKWKSSISMLTRGKGLERLVIYCRALEIMEKLNRVEKILNNPANLDHSISSAGESYVFDLNGLNEIREDYFKKYGEVDYNDVVKLVVDYYKDEELAQIFQNLFF